jgi:hypothetical protein
MSKKVVLIGADPEVFIKKITGKIMSVEGLLGGTKEKPLNKTAWGKGFAVQEDNVLAEYNIPACSTAEKFVLSHEFMLARIPEMIKERSNEDIEIKIISSHVFKAKQLYTEQALLFGCDPDVCVWDLETNEMPSTATMMRTAGGHIHVGWANPSLDDSINVIKYMDLLLGIPSIILDTDARRKELYGKSGAMRYKKYGVEYRTLSNFWLKSRALMTWAFEQSVYALELAQKGEFPQDLEHIQEIINTNNIEAAKELVRKYNINMP